jgi:hypothetical protein
LTDLADVPPWLLELLINGSRASKPTKIAASRDSTIREGTRNDSLYKVGCALRGQEAIGEEELTLR